MEFNQTPDPRNFPKPVADLIAEIRALHERRAGIGDRRRELGVSAYTAGSDQLMIEAQRRDSELLGQAARDGGSLATVGTPTADDLAARRADLEREDSALELALTATSEQLRAAVADNQDKIADGLNTPISSTRAAYRAALDSLEEARLDYLTATALGEWAERVAGTRPGSQATINFTAPTDRSLPGDGWQPLRFHEVIAAMRAEAE